MSLSNTAKATQTLAETLTPDQLALLARGRVDGWVTQDQILTVTPDAEENLENLDELMNALDEAGVTVMELSSVRSG